MKGRVKSAFQKCGCLLICICFIIGCFPTTLVQAITSESIQEKQEQIKQAQDEVQNLEGSISDIEQIKEELEKAKKDLASYVRTLDESIAVMSEKIANLEMQITQKEADILQTQYELDEAIQSKQDQYDSMSKRIKFIYENGSPNFLMVLLQSLNPGNFLNIADYMLQVRTHDQKMLDEYEMTCEYIELCIQELEINRENLALQKQQVEIEKANTQNLLTQKVQEVQHYQQEITNKQLLIDEYEAQLAQMEETISVLEQAIAEEKRRLIETGGAVLHFDGGVFLFPLATYTRISDDYGYRTHPILNVQQFHNGVDFASPAKTAIYCAYDGRVVAAEYSATMGNYVMVDHGDELYTIYMHASALYVEKGDVVVKGETIAAVGSTGRSTGNHLHFSVRLNGAYTSPWNYLSE
ncbi:MAG: peptidoglycan DD-metalloendopeptidase family protein [Lachnospiraceae bacterium]|jgi:murein DD-endopeptidase MepM/ murein hydrolase activator NlpD|nr:peptidoglycan DD-metalloendopeptidase family protein [Lachnospiraceae bacterium]